MKRNSGLIGPKRLPTITNTVGMYDTFDQYNARRNNTWAATPSFDSISFSSGASFNEGTLFTITVNTSNVITGTTLFFTIETVAGTVNTSDFTDFSTTGSFLINSNTGSFNKQLTFDGTSEPGDAFVVRIRTGSTSGTVVISTGTITILNPTFSIAPTSSSFNEGASLTFNVSTTNVNNQTLFYTLSGGITSADISGGSLSGSFFLSGNFGSFSVTAVNDVTTEGNETFVAELRIDSTFGTVVATSSTITINDTSTTPTASVIVSSPVGSNQQAENSNSGGIGLISGVTYDATSLGAVTSIDDLVADSGFAALPAFGYIKYIIAKSGGNQQVDVAFKRSGNTISQSIFTLNSAALSYTSGISSILFYGNDDHDSLFMDADGRGCIARSNTNAFTTTNWDKFQATTEVTINSALDTVSTYPVSGFISGQGATIVSFPDTGSAVWINLPFGTYKLNNFASQSLPATFTNLIGTGSPANSLWTMSDGVNQFMIGRYGNTSCLRITVNLLTGTLTVTPITLTNTPSQNNSTEEDCVGTQLFTVDGDFTWYANGNFWYGGTVAGGWKNNISGLFNTSGKSNFFAGNSTQTDMDIFGSIDNTGFLWFADWGHDDGGLFGVGNDSQLGTRQTSIRQVQPIAGSAGGGGGTPNTNHVATFSVTLTPAVSGTYFYSTNPISGGLTTADFTDSSFTGSFTVTNGSGSFTRSATGDVATEGAEQYTISIRRDSTSGAVIGTSPTVTINDTSIPLSASITPNVSNVNEGGSVIFNVSVSGSYTGSLAFTTTVNSGTVVAADFSDNALSGTVSVTSGSGSITRTLANDATTEGSESFRINVVQGSTVLATSSVVTINDTSTNPTASLTHVSSVNEGSSIGFTVNTTNFPSGTLFYTLENVSNWETNDQTATSGSFSVSGGTGSFSVTTIADGLTEGAEVFLARVRLTSITGTIIGSSGNVTINDTSTGTPEVTALYTFTEVIFNAGATGATGPTLGQVQAVMTGTPAPSAWNTNSAYLQVTSGIILWTVPETATYRITAEGAQGQSGGTSNRGASIRGDFSLTVGQKLRIVVGQSPNSTAGGGGSYVVRETGSTNADIFVIAGGGGGKTGGIGGTATTANSSNTVSNGNGGLGTSNSWGGPAGGGFFTSGAPNTGSQPGGSTGSGFLQGSAGGLGGAGQGGFGGGGAGGADTSAGGGGGGGYSGGSAGGDGSNGQGAGSYPNGTNQINAANTRIGAGRVVITRL
jgi:hypothetical protein